MKKVVLCALRDLCGEPVTPNFTPDSNHHSNVTRATRISSAVYDANQCYLLTISCNYGNIPPMIALAQKKLLITGPEVSRSFSQNGTPVSTPDQPTHKTDSANSLRITLLHASRPQLPWNHTLTQNPPGGASEPPKTLSRSATNPIEQSPIFRLRLLTDHGTRITEHAL
jgi:hypothetical protein